MDAKVKELEAKLRTLDFAVKRSDEVMKTNSSEAISRHEQSILTKINACHTLKDSIEEEKIVKEESVVTKFAYLKELVESKIRAGIDGLPLTTEGYSRAKGILESECGKTSEIVNAYVQNILELPVVKGANPNEVDKFYKTLLYNVQSLEILGKLERVNGMTRSMLDKLPGIKSDLVRGKEGWQDWGLAQLVTALKLWREINPCNEQSSADRKHRNRSDKILNTGAKQHGCLYCDDVSHRLLFDDVSPL